MQPNNVSQGTSAVGSGRLRRIAFVVAGVAILYLAVAYLLIPLGWEDYARRHPSFDDTPRITETGDDHPGDPLNVALVGTKEQVMRAMTAANWYEANALGIESDLRIAADTVLERSYDEAPVSNLYLYGRQQDLAFEKPVGDDPRKRNHVRLWLKPETDPQGNPVWIGSASYDERVGFSHTTGQITHHIAPDVDTERDRLMADLQSAGVFQEEYSVPGFHKVLEGRNGGGDPWHTDGSLDVGVLKPEE